MLWVATRSSDCHVIVGMEGNSSTQHLPLVLLDCHALIWQCLDVGLTDNYQWHADTRVWASFKHVAEGSGRCLQNMQSQIKNKTVVVVCRSSFTCVVYVLVQEGFTQCSFTGKGLNVCIWT